MTDSDAGATPGQMTGAELVAAAKRRVAEVSAQDAIAESERGPGVVLLDVREQNEWNLGHAAGARWIPRGQLEGKVEGMIPRDARVLVYCASGNRSALAADTLQRMGYHDVASVAGGFRAWVEAGGAVAD